MNTKWEKKPEKSTTMTTITPAEKKSFIKSFVKEVRVTRDKVLLNYTIPLSAKGLTIEEMPVLSTVHCGSAYRIRTGDLLLEREVS